MNPNESTPAAGKSLAAPKAPLGANVLMLVACPLMLLTVFAKPLGIPPGLQCFPALVAIVCILFSQRLLKKAKAAGRIAPLADDHRRKRFVLMTVTLLVASIASPFLMPLTGLALPFRTMVIVSIISFIISMIALWFGFRIGAKA